MNELSPQSTLTKWQVTRDAVGTVIDGYLPADTAVGFLFYPNQATIPNHLDDDAGSGALPTTACVNVSAMVNVAPIGAKGSVQRAALSQGLAKAQPAGGTPTDDAYTFALDHNLAPALDTYSSYVPYMVLITDGQPTISQGCKGTGNTSDPANWQPILDHITDGASRPYHVRTFVVGIPDTAEQVDSGANIRHWLSLAARAGKTQRSATCSESGPNYCHYDLSQSTDLAGDLAKGLSDIIHSIPCRLNIPSAPSGCTLDPLRINVVYKASANASEPAKTWLIGYSSSSSCGRDGKDDGWYIDPDSSTLVLCPTTCQTVQSDTRGQLEMISGCGAVVLPH